MASELEGVTELIAQFSTIPEDTEEAIIIGLNRTRRGSVGPRGILSKFIRDKYTIKAADAAATIRGTVNRRQLNLKLTVNDSVRGIEKFSGRELARTRRGGQRGVTFRVKRGGGRKRLRHAFSLGNPRKGPFFNRVDGRLVRKFSTAVSSAVKENRDQIDPMLSDLFSSSLRQALNQRLRILSGPRSR